jgi:hypothetical protein
VIFSRTVQLVFFCLRLVLHACVQTFDMMSEDKKKKKIRTPMQAPIPSFSSFFFFFKKNTTSNTTRTIALVYRQLRCPAHGDSCAVDWDLWGRPAQPANDCFFERVPANDCDRGKCCSVVQLLWSVEGVNETRGPVK